MNHVNYGRIFFESIEDFRKTVLLMFSFKFDNDLSTECGFLKDDINHLPKEGKNILIEQNEEYLYFIKNAGESIFEGILNK